MSKEKFRVYLLLPWLVLLLGTVISVAVWYYSDQGLLTQSETAFNSRSQEISDSVNARIKRDIYLLDSLQGLYASSDQVDRDEFDTFIGTLDLKNNYPGISALYYFELVNQENLSDFVTTVQSDVSLNPSGYPDFKVWPDTGVSERLILKYFYPGSGVPKALGFDFFSDAERKNVAEQAFATDQPTTTNKIDLVPDNVPGLNIVMPVYKNDALPTRENAVGVLVAAIKLDQFFSVVFDEKQKELWRDFDLQVFDVTPVEVVSGIEYVFDYDGENFIEAPDNLSKIFLLALAGRAWSLKIIANHDYGLDTYDHSLPLILLFGSLFITLLLFISLRLLVTSQQRATRRAEEMTRDLKESGEIFKAVTESAKDAIVMMDEKGLVVLWNKAAEEMFGYIDTQMIGKDLHQVISAKADHEEIAKILHSGENGKLEILNKNIELSVIKKDGTLFEVELTVSRVKLHDIWHTVGIMRNITERKKSETELLQRTEALERLNKSMVGRELKMIELKGEIEKLKNKKS